MWTGFTFWSSCNINLPVAIPLKEQHCLPRQQFLANSSQKSRASKPLHMDLRDFSVLSYEDHVWGTTAACHGCKSHDKSRRLLEKLSVCLTSWLSRKEPGSILELARIQPRKLPQGSQVVLSMPSSLFPKSIIPYLFSDTLCKHWPMDESDNPTSVQESMDTVLENSREDSNSSLWCQCLKEQPWPTEDRPGQKWEWQSESCFCVHILPAPPRYELCLIGKHPPTGENVSSFKDCAKQPCCAMWNGICRCELTGVTFHRLVEGLSSTASRVTLAGCWAEVWT